MNEITNDVNVQVSENGETVTYHSERSQKFSADDYVAVYNDTVNQLQSHLNQLENLQEEIEKMLDEKTEAMHIIHTLVESEEQDDAELERNSLTVDDLNAFMQLQQKNQQKKQIQNQVQQTRKQVSSMRGAAERLADDDELEEAPQPGKEELEIPTK